MPLSRTLIWLSGALALMLIAGPLRAQDRVPAEGAVQPEEEKPPTPWPPKDAQRHEIKRENQTQGLILYTPRSWKKDSSQNAARLAEFAVSGTDSPVELRVFSFENIQSSEGGGVQATIERWTNQFENVRAKKVLTGTARKEGVQDRMYVLVDVTGDYKQPGGGQLKNARLLAAIVGLRWKEDEKIDGETETVQKSAVYFLEMVGPEKTVSANERHFRHSFGAVDQEYELPDRPAD